MTNKLALVFSLALSAAAHEINRPKRAPSPTIVERAFPYPTGPGYDVVPLSSIVPLSPGEPALVFYLSTLTDIPRVFLKSCTRPIHLSTRVNTPHLQRSSHPNL